MPSPSARRKGTHAAPPHRACTRNPRGGRPGARRGRARRHLAGRAGHGEQQPLARHVRRRSDPGSSLESRGSDQRARRLLPLARVRQRPHLGPGDLADAAHGRDPVGWLRLQRGADPRRVPRRQDPASGRDRRRARRHHDHGSRMGRCVHRDGLRELLRAADRRAPSTDDLRHEIRGRGRRRRARCRRATARRLDDPPVSGRTAPRVHRHRCQRRIPLRAGRRQPRHPLGALRAARGPAGRMGREPHPGPVHGVVRLRRRGHRRQGLRQLPPGHDRRREVRRP